MPRAARRAKEIAYRTNTPLVVVRDGVVGYEWVTEADIDEFVRMYPASAPLENRRDD